MSQGVGGEDVAAAELLSTCFVPRWEKRFLLSSGACCASDFSIYNCNAFKDWQLHMRKEDDGSFAVVVEFGTNVPLDFVRLNHMEVLQMFQYAVPKHNAHLASGIANDEFAIPKALMLTLTTKQMNAYIDSLPGKRSTERWLVLDEYFKDAEIVINLDKLRALGFLALNGLAEHEVQELVAAGDVVNGKFTPYISFTKNRIQIRAKCAGGPDFIITFGDWVFYSLMDVLRQSENSIVNVRHTTICDVDGLSCWEAFDSLYKSSTRLYTPNCSDQEALILAGLCEVDGKWKLSKYATVDDLYELMKGRLKRAQPAAITYMLSHVLSLFFLYEDFPTEACFYGLRRIESFFVKLGLPPPSDFASEIHKFCTDQRIPRLLHNIYCVDQRADPKFSISNIFWSVVDYNAHPLGSFPCHKLKTPMYGVLKYISDALGCGGMSRAISLYNRMAPDIQAVVIQYLCDGAFLEPFIISQYTYENNLTDSEKKFFLKLNATQPGWFYVQNTQL